MASASPMYELMYIINPVLNEEQTGDIVKRVETYLKDNGASIDQTNVIGSQRPAGPTRARWRGSPTRSRRSGTGTT